MRNKNPITAVFALMGLTGLGFVNATAQFPIKLPKIKIEKPKTEQPKTDGSQSADPSAPASPASARPDSLGARSGRIYGPIKPDDRQLLIRDSIYIQASTHKDYWKMPGQKHSSWVPTVKLGVFFTGYTVPYVAEYFNPDGSPWFSESLKESWPDGEETVWFQSDNITTYNARETKSTVATGVYGVKVTNANTGAAVFQGKFKVGKFLPPYRSPNESEFYVDHDWVMPIGYISYDFSNFKGSGYGGFAVKASMWFKKDMPDRDNGLEARLFFNGRQVATTGDGSGSVVQTASRASSTAKLSADLHHWELWTFNWKKAILDNGGGYNPDNHPNAHLVDKNPGDYVIKVFKNDVLVREAKFTVGPDGRVGDSTYHKPDYLTYHKVIIPVTVIGQAEKYNAAAWKTEAFYNNPMAGFSVP